MMSSRLDGNDGRGDSTAVYISVSIASTAASSVTYNQDKMGFKWDLF